MEQHMQPMIAPNRRTTLTTLAKFAAARAHHVILIAVVLLGLLYSISTPIFEKPDEDEHFAFARLLALGGGLPVQRPGVPAPWGQEGSQPPLYYALASLVVRGFDTSDFTRQRQPNAAPLYSPDASGNKNKLLITPEKRALAYRDTTAAAATLRLLGILPGLFTAWAAYQIARRVSTARQTALLALGLTAFNPMLIYITTSVSNDGLVVALCSGALLILVALLLSAELTRRASLARAALLGLLIALASLTKVSGVLLLPVALAALPVQAFFQHRANSTHERPRWGRALLQSGIVLAVWLLVAGWWYARNIILYGEPTGALTMAQVIGARQVFLPEILGEWNGFRMSYLALFGQFNIPADPLVYTLLDLQVLACITGFGIAVIRNIRRLRREGLQSALAQRAFAGAVLAAYVLVVLASIVRWTMITPASQGRLIFPAIAAISTFLAIGLRQFDRPIAAIKDWRPYWMTPVLIGAMGIVTLLAPWRYIAPAYAPPLLTHVPDELPRVTQYFGPWAELVGYHMNPLSVRPGERVRVTAILRAHRVPRDNYSLVVKLYGRDNAELARFDTFTGEGLLPSSQWQIGDLWHDEVDLAIPPSARAPAILRAQFELYNHGSGEIVTSTNGRGHPGAPLFDGAILLPPPRNAPRSSKRLATFSDAAVLFGFATTPPRPGQLLTVTLSWLTFKPIPVDHSIFVHLVDGAGKMWAQHDGPPDGGNYPTSRWCEGAQFDDAHVLDLPADLPPGNYLLVVGLYNPGNGERLAALDSLGAAAPDRTIILQRIRIGQF
jgi:hypothetical protein